jgi:hypothetical protein|tara:strand:- start:143 stop:520 length:378 start_codon:yes stop_codon:yes gene_type:complete
MIKLKDMISENVWDRKFGEPLPTLKDVVTKHNKITEDDCGCSGTTSCACESVNEGPDEKIKANKELQRVMKAEAKLRERMMKLEQIYLQDARPENQKLAKEIKESYKKHVTTFMKDVIKLTKKVK